MSNIAVYRSSLEQKRQSFTVSNPDVNFDNEVNFALQALQNNSALAQCDQQSFVKAVMNVALTGLTLNPNMAHGYLVPRRGKVVFQPGYQGLIYLMSQSGLTKLVEARAVYERDFFEINYGTSTEIKHVPCTDGHPGQITGFYCVAKLANDEKYVEYLTTAKVYEIAMQSDMNKAKKQLTGAWLTSFDEMGRKTMVRRVYKYIPKHTVNKDALAKLNAAMAADDAAFHDRTVSTIDLLDTDYIDVTTQQQQPPPADAQFGIPPQFAQPQQAPQFGIPPHLKQS